MKSLVYTTAFGEDHFFRLAGEMFRSLRKRGYAGEAVLLCDRDPGFPAELHVAAVVLKNIGAFPLLKARLSQFWDVAGYDAILFVDSDVVFLREPSPLFAAAGQRMAVSRDHYPLRRNNFNLTFFPIERRREIGLGKIRSINTGVMVFPGGRYAEYAARWLRAWNAPAIRRRLRSYPMKFAELRDQPVLQKLVTEEGLDCGFIPDELLLMPLFFTENHPLGPAAILLHLNGSGRSTDQKQHLLGIMTELNGLHDFADIKRVCERLQAGRRRFSFPAFRPNPASALIHPEAP